MLCERCHKNLAVLKYTEVVNGKAFVRNICATCLGQLQSDPGTGFEVSGAAPAPKRRAGAGSAPADVTVPNESCPSCGMPLTALLKEGAAGCQACYRHFDAAVDAMLRDRQYGLRHRGKTPQHDDRRAALRGELQTKRALLRSALKMESYEEAAVLRDQIRDLETTLGASAAGTH